MNGIYQLLINTPWWVYLILIYLIIVGIKASKTRIVSLKKLFIIPLVFLIMSIETLISSFKIDLLNFSIWSLGILIGAIFGYIQTYRYKLKIDKENGLLEIPGTWSTLVIISVIFIAKYYISYELAVDPAIINENVFEISALLVTGVCTGLFIGRLCCYLYRFQTENSVSLKTSN